VGTGLACPMRRLLNGARPAELLALWTCTDNSGSGLCIHRKSKNAPEHVLSQWLGTHCVARFHLRLLLAAACHVMWYNIRAVHCGIVSPQLYLMSVVAAGFGHCKPAGVQVVLCVNCTAMHSLHAMYQVALVVHCEFIPRVPRIASAQ
jgi:hypothetical protein